METTTHYRTCPFCEATCGLAIETREDEVVAIRGDADDVFSRGFLCPKAASLKALHEDPDRLRTPLVRRDGELREATWDEALAEIEARVRPILDEHGPSALGAYIGNPSAHDFSASIFGSVLLRAMGTHSIFSASTVDQMPKQVSAGLMFGTMLSIPVPDIDRTDYFLVLGANPLVSNGSLLTAPDMRGRIRAIRERGGKVVVVDPKRTRTAEHADEHHFIRPGTDAHLLAGLLHTIFAEGLATPGPIAEYANGLDEVERIAAEFPPEAVAPLCGIEAETIRELARELAAAERAAVYGRMGTTTQEFGTVASWLIDVLNAVTGNLDREGGAMFTLAAAGQRNSQGAGPTGRGVLLGRWTSRVRGAAEAFGELPAACLAEEIDTPGEGQIRALVTVAGNPVLSTPNGDRLEAALESLDAMICIDIYVNETTRHADVILPARSPLQKSHYDIGLYQLAARNVANYSAPVFETEPGMPAEWEVLLRVAGVFAGQGPDADVEALDEMTARAVIQREIALPGSALADRDQEEILAALEPRRGPERILDFMLRAGPYGDHFGAKPDGLTLAVLEESPHGVDLGPLQPRLPEVLRTPSGKIELAPAPIVADVDRLRASLERRPNGELLLIGRRTLRSHNSWMHNLQPLVKGKDRCTLQIHPSTADELGLADGSNARVTSRAGSLEAPVEITDAIMPGVVSIPHGWGHGGPGTRMGVAARHPGVNANLLTDDALTDAVSGNAAVNGVTVEVAPATAAVPAGVESA